MGRKRLTLEGLVAERRFNAGNFRHRRVLDESEPLDDPELESARYVAASLRQMRGGARVRAAQELQRFARLVADRPRR